MRFHRTEKYGFFGKTTICRFVECRIGWGKFLTGGVKGVNIFTPG